MTLPALLVGCTTRHGANESAIRRAEEQLGRPLPPDYKVLLHESDGLEGFVDEELYLTLWSTSDVPALNDAYCVAEFVPGLTLIGTDGANIGYGFRAAEEAFEYVSVPLVGMRPQAVTALGRSLSEFLHNLTLSH